MFNISVDGHLHSSKVNIATRLICEWCASWGITTSNVYPTSKIGRNKSALRTSVYHHPCQREMKDLDKGKPLPLFCMFSSCNMLHPWSVPHKNKLWWSMAASTEALVEPHAKTCFATFPRSRVYPHANKETRLHGRRLKFVQFENSEDIVQFMTKSWRR
jgi:hypothetical protein